MAARILRGSERDVRQRLASFSAPSALVDTCASTHPCRSAASPGEPLSGQVRRRRATSLLAFVLVRGRSRLDAVRNIEIGDFEIAELDMFGDGENRVRF
jgi:hypothetical protein